MVCRSAERTHVRCARDGGYLERAMSKSKKQVGWKASHSALDASRDATKKATI